MNRNEKPAAMTPAASTVLAAAPALFVVLWATGFIGARLGIPDAEPFTFLLLRFVIAGTILGAVAFVMRAPWPPTAGEWIASIVAGALIQGVYLGAVFWAISRGMPAGVAALIVALQPLMTAILAGYLLRERILPNHWYGLGIGLIGLVLVLGPGLQWHGEGITPVTIAATVVAVLGIVLGSIGQKAFATQSDLRTGTCLQYVGGAILAAIGAVLTETFRIDWTPAFTFALGWLVLVLSLGAVLLYMLLLRHGEVARVATLFYLVPPVTVLIAWVMFGETLTALQLAGMAVTVAGVGLATRRGA